MKLLLIEDDEDFGAALRDGLQQEGHEVLWVRGGARFESMLLSDRFDAVLLDLTLPDADGQVLLREMRQRRDTTPLIVISARGQHSDRIDMLDLGADDYLVKPIDLGELSARLRAVTRRVHAQPGRGSALQHGALRLDPAQGTVSWRGRRIVLRERERWLLEQFMRHPTHLFSRTQLEAALYGGPTGIESNTIEVYVHYLRRKLAPDIIVTVRGLGYRLGPAHPES
ncbi:response regulator transcription factor [Aquabacterium humicola]|uniref:response regulator transcription factor n=1 Tax=Aquabacterium humicola TaxID=3237377 RepID=UPI00254338C5|nr:response regulator transcription factor [Rubrivivax pictus]